MSWFLRCSWCGGPFNGGNYRRCTNVSFEDEFVRNPDPISYDETPYFSYPPPQPQTYSCELCGNDSIMYSIDHQPQSIQEDLNEQMMNDECIKSHNDMIDLRNEPFKTMQSLFGMLREHAANLSTHTPEPSRRFNYICYDDDDDDDDEESTIPLNERWEWISLYSEKESDEFIKSSVEDLVPIPRESEDTSDSDKESDLPFCNNSVTFSNPLFDVNDDFTSSDDESLPEGGDIDEIDAFLDIDVSTDIEDGYHDSEGDVIYLECLLTNDTTHNLPQGVFRS
ncbi:hypothetical protein Tco_0441856 [Tanacetum coccineum]